MSKDKDKKVERVENWKDEKIAELREALNGMTIERDSERQRAGVSVALQIELKDKLYHATIRLEECERSLEESTKALQKIQENLMVLESKPLPVEAGVTEPLNEPKEDLPLTTHDSLITTAFSESEEGS